MLRSFLDFDCYSVFKEMDRDCKGFVDIHDFSEYFDRKFSQSFNATNLFRFWTN